MMLKTFNTLLINAGMPEETKEHFMGHVISNTVQDAYLADPQELLKLTNPLGFVHAKNSRNLRFRSATRRVANFIFRGYETIVS
jgi:hypothetical protein